MLSELFGTFFLVLAGTGAIVVGLPLWGVALAFGLAVALLAPTGAHLNPAVTVGLWKSGRFPKDGVLPRLAAQCLGALLASLLLHSLAPSHPTLGATEPSGTAYASFALEAGMTGALMLAVLTVPGPWKLALAAGAVVGLEAWLGGPVSGASMNPARSLAPALVSGRLGFLWIYLAAPTLGAFLAVPLCARVRGRACCPGSACA